MTAVPTFWIWASGIYFCVSILWSVALIAGMLVVYKKTMPVLDEARAQLMRISNQARSVMVKASNTVEIVHAQTQNLLGNAQSAGTLVTKQARTVGAALTAMLVAARVMNFVRKVF